MRTHEIKVVGFIKQADCDYVFHVAGYDAEQQRTFNRVFWMENGQLRGSLIENGETPLSRGCLLCLKQRISEVVSHKNKKTIC